MEAHAGTGDRMQLSGGCHQIEPRTGAVGKWFFIIGNALRVASIKEGGQIVHGSWSAS